MIRTKEEIMERIEKDLKDCAMFGRMFTNYGQTAKDMHVLSLSDLFCWQDIDALCWVLGISSVPYWNKLCEKYPVLGQVQV